MSLSTRRRAIFTGLSGHFAGDELLAVLALWEAKYADKPPFALNEFLAEVAQHTERKLERAKLYRELVGALTGPLSGLLADPEAQLRSWRQRTGGANLLDDEQEQQARKTFEALVRSLLNSLNTDIEPRLRRFAVGNLAGFEALPEQRMQARAWLEQDVSLLGSSLGVKHLRQLLNLLYVGLCEYLGPVVADQRLSQAVQAVETQALPFTPRQLL
ncbi:hypothetical protein [Pseudomonas sp. 5P_3.1_Bac2]|uniref:hypothetical protein n=1 Tax=Pseudomonas sp. 5P_3.1_Bac2 TaxID=2971617 RepID=UPI0021C7D59E|nr:hypothetical protein [Pseudomonas sp. 5P_3.1_Bac2]MCU1715520.1 hypothetical protein [Pseudomonas sp. 5P_3.1_Bac2]